MSGAGLKIVLIWALALAVGGTIAGRAQAVSLEDALVAAYQNSPILLARRAEQRAIDERMAQAVSGWRPTVTGAASYQERHQDSGIGGADSPVNPDVQFNPFRVGATLEQPIYRGGQTLAEMRQAKAEVHQGRANLRAAEQDVLLNTAISFFDVRQDLNVRDLNLNNVNVLRQQLAATEDRYAVGEITRTDVAQAEAALSSAVASFTIAEARLTGSRARYQRYVGMLPANLEAPAGLPPLPASEDDALAIAVERNPFLIAARYGEDASRHFVRRAVGNTLPTVSLEGEFSRTKEPSQFREFTRVRQVMARVSVPFYQAGGASSRVREARQFHNQRRIETLETDREMRKRLRAAWADFVSAQSSITSRRDQVRANEIALEGVRQEVLVGTRTTLDALEEEQRNLDSRVELENAIHDEYAAAYQILSVIGELAPEKLNLGVTSYDPAQNYRKVRYKSFGLGQSADADPLPNADMAPVSTTTPKVSQGSLVTVPTDGLEAEDAVAEAGNQATAIEAAPKAEGTDVYLVQIAAYRTAARADQGWKILSERHGQNLGNRSPDIVSVNLGAKGNYYRLRAGPAANKKEARQLCAALIGQGLNCLVVRP